MPDAGLLIFTALYRFKVVQFRNAGCRAVLFEGVRFRMRATRKYPSHAPNCLTFRQNLAVTFPLLVKTIMRNLKPLLLQPLYEAHPGNISSIGTTKKGGDHHAPKA